MSDSPKLLIRDFHVFDVSKDGFHASWVVDTPVRCRLLISTSPSTVGVLEVPAGEGTAFHFDSHGTSYSSLPPMGRFFLRVLAEDDEGRRAVSDTVEMIVSDVGAIDDVFIAPLGEGEAVVMWRSNEPTYGQTIFVADDGDQVVTPIEPCLRVNHSRTVRGLAPKKRWSIRIRQALRREKWGDQFLYSGLRFLPVEHETRDIGRVRILRLDDGGAVIANGRLRLVLTPTGGIRLFRSDDQDIDTLLVPASDEPLFYLETDDGRIVSDFSEAATVSEASEVNTEFGRGVRLEVEGTHVEPQLRLIRRVHVEVYENHPDAALVRVEYEAVEGGLTVAAATGPALRLDRRLALRKPVRAEPWQFAAYLPVSHKDNFGETYTVIRVTKDFKRDNPTAGDSGQLKHITGVPFFDLWCPETGIGLGHLAPHPIAVSFPVMTNADGSVTLSFRDERIERLGGGEKYESPPLLLVAHRGDFYDAVSRFREMMRARGIAQETPPAEAYEPVWSTWGYVGKFTRNDVLDALPYLKQLGIHWIQLDDPWYTDHGDYAVNRKVFSGGEDDLAEFIRTLQADGFKVRLWSCPGNVSSNAEYVKKHPDRMIQDAAGQPVAVHNAGVPEGATEWMLCPCVDENLKKVRDGVSTLVERLGGDAVYHDGVYGCPPCASDEHGHDGNADVYAAHPKIFQEAQRQVVASRGEDVVVMLCTCGKVPDFYILPYHNRVATADPMNVHVRKRVKHLKALLGPRAAVDFDFVEVSGNDFASAIGTGACLYLKFTTPFDPRLWEAYRRWMKIAREHPTARGEYLNLYDLAADLPEAHAVGLNGRIYYGFFASEWAGDYTTEFSGGIELRGLEPGQRYTVTDYVNKTALPSVTGPVGKLDVSFRGSLLLYAEIEK